MQFARSGSVQPISVDWHEQRQRAREQAFSSDLSFFSAKERIKYDLDTAQINGSDNPRLFLWMRTLDVLGTNGTDVRELYDR